MGDFFRIKNVCNGKGEMEDVRKKKRKYGITRTSSARGA